MEMARRDAAKFQEVGFTNAQLMDVPSGYPPIYGEIAGPEGSPVVMLYAHYDVQPAPPEQGWTTDPWTATSQGRTAASTDAAPPTTRVGWPSTSAPCGSSTASRPCTVRLIVEGMEETESNLEAFVEAHPELFDCDLFIVCDMGNLRVGEPVLTTHPARRRRLHRDRAHPRAPTALRACSAARRRTP